MFYTVFRIKLRGVINGKAGKAAAFPKFSDMLTLYQPGGPDYAHIAHPLALSCLEKSVLIYREVIKSSVAVDYGPINVSAKLYSDVNCVFCF